MLSEAEMKEFFQRVVDEVAQLSTQASQVEGLRQYVQELSGRVVALEAANADLRNTLEAADRRIVQAEAQADSFRNQLESERNATQALRETIFQRDQYVKDLSNQYTQECDAHKITTSERDDARTKISELASEIDHLRGHLDQTTVERNDWRDKAIDLEAKVNDLNTRLDRVNSILNPIRAVPSADVA